MHIFISNACPVHNSNVTFWPLMSLHYSATTITTDNGYSRLFFTQYLARCHPSAPRSRRWASTVHKIPGELGYGPKEIQMLWRRPGAPGRQKQTLSTVQIPNTRSTCHQQRHDLQSQTKFRLNESPHSDKSSRVHQQQTLQRSHAHFLATAAFACLI
jgi:hypothetical protein